MLFLSYAEEDGEMARTIVDWFKQQHIDVFFWEEPEQRGGRFIEVIEEQLGKADAFLALYSPHFLDSKWCHRETQLAIHREVQLQGQSGGKFIRVLKIAETPRRDPGFLRIYDWFDLTDQGSLEQRLGSVATSLRHSISQVRAPAAARPAVPVATSFRNREYEVERVLRGIANPAGPHLWVVIAPPQLGKTWFMDQVAAKAREEGTREEGKSWSVGKVDIRVSHDEVRRDIAWLLGRLFGVNDLPASIDDRALGRIAREILHREKPHLCLLDSAELLDEEIVMVLRAHLGAIDRLVQQGGNPRVQIAFIAATRRDDEWRRSPGPRPSLLPLTEFKIDVVQDALRDLARQMSRTFGNGQLRDYAAMVYRLSEGLPALLALCLQWIQREEWIAMEELASQELFEALAENYIQDLLESGNLFRRTRQWDNEARLMVEDAFRILVPYRLFTQSHLRYHMDADTKFAALLARSDLSADRLWEAISGTALLHRPLDEAWQEVQHAIRRLLFRYFYKSDEERALAHERARKFAEIWFDGQSGTEQVIGLVEGLWHEAAALAYSRALDMEELLSRSASSLAESLKPSPLYTESELRQAAARRMRDNEEFQDTLADVPGLFDKLVRIVETGEEA